MASPFLSKNDGRALDGIWSWATVRHPWPTRGGLIASSGLTRVAVRRCSSMLTVFETLWYACLAYTGFILYRRWVVYSRTRHFILEQRRKAGIPDSDHRSLPEAAADAAARRQIDYEKQLQSSDDVFRPHVSRSKALHSGFAPKAVFRPIPVPDVEQEAKTARAPPLEDPETFYGPRVSRRLHSTPILAAKKRMADEISEAPEVEQRRSTVPRRVRRKVSVEAPDLHEAEEAEAMDEEVEENASEEEIESSMDEEDISYDDDSEDMDEEETGQVESQPASTSMKRSADTSADHAPGDEWTDANGLRWCIGDDGIPRRAVMLIEMRPKYSMPRDTVHPDAQLRVPTYVERFLSHEEYEEAKRKKQLSWQHELSHAKGSSPSSFQSDDVEDSLASMVARRSRGQASRKGAHDLLFSDMMRSRRPNASSADDSPSNISMSDASFDDSASFSSSFRADQADLSGRLRLSRSTASPMRRDGLPSKSLPLLQQRYTRMYAPSPLSSPARRALDPEAKRKREERLMSRIRDEREKSRRSNQNS